MEKFLEIGLLYDFYNQMLTDKQRLIIELYYNNDFSLSEISQSMNISRQGVYDLLKRSENLLYYYEEKLKLAEKFKIQKNKIKEAYNLLDSLDGDEKIDRIKSILGELISD